MKDGKEKLNLPQLKKREMDEKEQNAVRGGSVHCNCACGMNVTMRLEALTEGNHNYYDDMQFY